MKVGIQSNVWAAEYHREQLPQMLTEIAAAGYDGVEVGAHKLESLDQPEAFSGMVRDAGLHVAGIHTLARLYFEQVLVGDHEYVDRAADFAKGVAAEFMLVSGERGEGKTADDYKRLADALNRSGEICRERGLTYCYHNHWWEIEREQAELRTLLDFTDPGLVSLCLDVGWVARAGASPAAVTREFLDRIRYFHIKDTRDGAFTEVGSGTVDFQSVLAVIQGKAHLYLTVERDQVLPDALESARKSREYLKGLGV